MRLEGMRRVLASWRSLALVSAVGICGLYWSCGDGDETNLLQPLAEPSALDSDRHAKLEQARVHMDREEYDEALAILAKLIADAKEDSNEIRLLDASAKLGASKLDVWSIISNIVASQDKKDAKGGGGLDQLFDALGGDILGGGVAKEQRLKALVAAIRTLQAAPVPADQKLANTSCLLAGLLVAASLPEAVAAATHVTTALAAVRSSASSDACPDIGTLDQAMAQITSVAESFTVVLEAARSCSFIDADDAEASANAISRQLTQLRNAADRGCSQAPACGASANCFQNLPSCAQQALNAGAASARAGDGRLASCEIALHCALGSASGCFGKA